MLEHVRDDQHAHASPADEDVVEVRDAAVARRRGDVAELEVPAVLGLGEVAAKGLAGLELDLLGVGFWWWWWWWKKGVREEEKRRTRSRSSTAAEGGGGGNVDLLIVALSSLA